MIRRILRYGRDLHYLQQAPPPSVVTTPILTTAHTRVCRYCTQLLMISYPVPLFQTRTCLLPQRCYSTQPSTGVESISPSPQPPTINCWKCGRQIPTMKAKKVLFFCPCDERVVLPPSVTNYFTILES